MYEFIVEKHNKNVTSDVSDPKTFHGALSTRRGKLLKFIMISELKNLYRRAWMTRNLERERTKGRKTIPTKWYSRLS